MKIIDTNILKNLEDKKEEKNKKNQKMLTCTKCKDSTFNDRDELRKHYKTNWHKYNALQSSSGCVSTYSSYSSADKLLPSFALCNALYLCQFFL